MDDRTKKIELLKGLVKGDRSPSELKGFVRNLTSSDRECQRYYDTMLRELDSNEAFFNQCVDWYLSCRRKYGENTNFFPKSELDKWIQILDNNETLKQNEQQTTS